MSSLEDRSLADVLRDRLIPEWERFGLNRLAVTASTLAGFQT